MCFVYNGKKKQNLKKKEEEKKEMKFLSFATSYLGCTWKEEKEDSKLLNEKVKTPKLKIPSLSHVYLQIQFGVVTFYCQGIDNQHTVSETSSGWLYKYKKKIYVIGCAHGLLITNIQTPYPQITVGIAGLNGDGFEM